MAQDSWKVYCGKKELLNTSVSDEEKNIIPLGDSELSSNAEFILQYKDKSLQKDWKRIIALFDEKDSQLLIKEDTKSVTLPMSEIKNLLDKNGRLKIYTWALPKDPELAARIRIRRIYLCTIDTK